MIFFCNLLLPNSFVYKNNLEVALIQRCRKKDRAAFDELVTPYLGRMHSVAFSKLGNAADAEEVVQDSLMEAWQDIKSLRNPYKFYWWVRKIVIHQAQDWLRKQGGKKRIKLYSDLSEEELYMVQQKLQKDCGQEANPHEIIRCIHQLPEDYREIIYLRFYLGFSRAEISHDIGISIKAVEMRIYRGKKLLMKQLVKRFKQFKRKQ